MCTNMNRATLIIRTIAILLCSHMSLTYAEQYVCTFSSNPTTSAAGDASLIPNSLFVVDNLTGDIYGEQLVEYMPLRIRNVSRNPENGSFRISYFTNGTARSNYLIVFPTSGSGHRFSFHLGGSRFMGVCAEAPNNQINKEAAGGSYYYGRYAPLQVR